MKASFSRLIPAILCLGILLSGCTKTLTVQSTAPQAETKKTVVTKPMQAETAPPPTTTLKNQDELQRETKPDKIEAGTKQEKNQQTPNLDKLITGNYKMTLDAGVEHFEWTVKIKLLDTAFTMLSESNNENKGIYNKETNLVYMDRESLTALRCDLQFDISKQPITASGSYMYNDVSCKVYFEKTD